MTQESEGLQRAETRATGLEPATSGVTGRRSNQLNYARWQGKASERPGSRLATARRGRQPLFGRRGVL